MKIMIDARTLGERPSGVGIYAYRFARALSEDPATQLVLLTDVCQSAEMQALAARANVSVLAYGSKIRKGPALWLYFRFLRRAIEREKPELFWEVNNLLPVRLRNPYGKYVVTIHDIFPLTLPEQHPALFRAYFRCGLARTVRCCDAVIFLTRSMQREITARYPRLNKLPQHVAYAVAESAPGGKAEREDFFLYVGNLEKRKGADLLIEAYRLYCARGGKAELRLAGKLRDADIERQLRAAERELPGLRYLGYVTEEERDALYRSCRCLLFPSRAEGFGIPLIEALDCGADVIASDIGVFEEIAGDRVRSFPLERGAEGLCEKMLEDAPAPAGDWVNPFTAEKLTPPLRDFFRRLTRKTICLDGQVLMDEVPTGIGILAEELTRRLARDGRYECVIRAFSMRRSAAQMERLRRFGIDDDHIQICRFFPRGVYLRLWRYLPIPWSLFFPGKTDLSIFWNYDTPPGVKGKSLVYVHDVTYLRYPETMDAEVLRLLRRNLDESCRRADRIITPSQFTKDEMVELLGLESGRISAVLSGVDHERFRPQTDGAALAAAREKYGIPERYFLYVGTLEPRKNLMLLLRAYEKLLERGEDCPALVLGGKKGWLYESMMALAESEPLRSHVIFTDYLPREEIPVLMGGALAFVFPSLYEGFGLPPLEAMACGTPVIVSDRASLPEVVGDAGLVVSVETEQPLCEAMLRLMREPETCRELSRLGRERAARFTWENTARDLLAVCDELSGRTE